MNMQKTTLIGIVLFTGLLGCTSKATGLPTGKGGDLNSNPDVAVRAFELRMAGRVDEAKKLLEKAVAANPKNAPAQFELARDYFYTIMDQPDQVSDNLKQKQMAMKNNLRQARKAIQKAIKANPDNPRYHYWAGKIATYNAINDAHSIWTMPAVPTHSNDAIRSYEKAVDLKPDFHQARLELMGCYDRLPWLCGGNKSKAEQHTRRLERMDPVYGAKARCEIQPRKTREEKIAIWEKIIHNFPDNAGAHVGLARELMHEGDLPASDMEMCVEHIDKALELDPSHSEILLDLAWHYRRAKQPDKAKDGLQRFLHQDPSPPVALQAIALRELATIQSMQGKEQEAESLVKHADELDPTNWPPFRWRPPTDLYVAP